MWIAVLICLGIGALCGFFNGLVLTRFKELPPMIVTLSSMMLYRGIALIILEDHSSGNFPAWFAELGWGSMLGIPIILWIFIICAIIFTLVLHKTNFGRQIYAIGSNRIASKFSGVNIERTRLIVYTLVGLMSALASLFLTSRTNSARPNIATGYEMDVIAMVVLGGVSSLGGTGKMAGPLISIMIIGFLRYGLGLMNVQTPVLLIITGCLLVFAVLISNRNALRITKINKVID
jgi:rhamnose transport system permease protein